MNIKLLKFYVICILYNYVNFVLYFNSKLFVLFLCYVLNFMFYLICSVIKDEGIGKCKYMIWIIIFYLDYVLCLMYKFLYIIFRK